MIRPTTDPMLGYVLTPVRGGVHCADCETFLPRVAWIRRCDARPLCGPCYIGTMVESIDPARCAVRPDRRT